MMQQRFEERQVSGYTVRIDRTLCIASKNCIAVAPEVFVLGEDQIVTFVDEPEDIEPERLVEACAVCPVDTFTVLDGNGQQIVP